MSLRAYWSGCVGSDDTMLQAHWVPTRSAHERIVRTVCLVAISEHKIPGAVVFDHVGVVDASGIERPSVALKTVL
jgi:hypothetical protein